MNHMYLKNLCLQQLEGGESYLQIFKDSLSKFVSLEILNAVICLVIGDDDEHALGSLLDAFIRMLETSVMFHEEFEKSDFHMILFRRILNHTNYTKLRCIYSKVEARRAPTAIEDIEFLGRNVYNYCLYKKMYGDFQFDLEQDVASLEPAEVGVFLDVLREICIDNRENTGLVEYLRRIAGSVNVDLLLAIADPKFTIHSTMVGSEDVFVLHPSQVIELDERMLVRMVLCGVNAEHSQCKVCGKRVLGCDGNAEEYLDAACAERYLGVAIVDIDELCNAVSHWKAFRSHRVLTALLRLIFKIQSNLEYCIHLRWFIIEEGSIEESTMITLLKHVSETLSIDDVSTVVKMFPYTDRTPKVAFSYFAVLFNGLTRHSANAFLKDVILNIAMRSKAEFMRIRPMIFEYYLSTTVTMACEAMQSEHLQAEYDTECCGNTSGIHSTDGHSSKHKEHVEIKKNARFEDFFGPLALFFSEDCEMFVRNNMFYIYPMIYSIPLFSRYVSDPDFSRTNGHLLVISLLLQGNQDKVQCMGYEGRELMEMGVEVIAPLFFSGYFKYSVLERLFGDVNGYIGSNLPRFLFALKRIYVERPFELKVCVFKVMKHVIDAVNESISAVSNCLFPFVEFFIRKHEDECGVDCKSVFIEYYSSFFDAKQFMKCMPRIFLYMDVERIVEWSSIGRRDEYLDLISRLLDARGYFVQEIATTKAVELLERMFMEQQALGACGVKLNTAGNNAAGVDAAEAEREEVFAKNMLRCFFTDECFRVKIGDVYKKLRIVDGKSASLIGSISRRYLPTDPLCIDSEVPCIECSSESIASVMVEMFLLEINPRKQDIYFFVIQETLKYVSRRFDRSVESIIEQFRGTQYFYEHLPARSTEKMYDRTYAFRRFLENMYGCLLYKLDKLGKQEYFDLLKYGGLLDEGFLEFNCLCLCKMLLECGDSKVLEVTTEIADDLDVGIDAMIPRFVLKLDRFSGRRYIDEKHLLRIALFLKDYYTAIQVLEKMIRKEKHRSMFDLLQYGYYMIGDYGKVMGISSMFARPNATNLFFGFCIDRNFEAAKRCLGLIGKQEGEDEKMRWDERVDAGKLFEEVVGKIDDEIAVFVADCKRIEGEFCRWKELNGRCELSRHFIKDCELVSKSRDVLSTLGVIAGRRDLADNNMMLLRCHLSLSVGVRSMLEKADSDPYDALVDIIGIYRGAEDDEEHSQRLSNDCRGCFEDLASIGSRSISDCLKLRRRISNRDGGAGDTECYESLNDFERDVRLEMIRRYRIEGDSARCAQEIGDMLLRNDWAVLYELAELKVAQGRIGNAKSALKKILELFPMSSMHYRRALVRYTELVDTKAAYEHALSILGDNGRLLLLGAKRFESTEAVKAMGLYIRGVECDRALCDEAIPRIFHLFSEMSSPSDTSTGARLLKGFVQSSMALLPPYYNQILSRLSHPNAEVVDEICNVVYVLMENYPNETFWKSLIMVNSQVLNTRRRMDGIMARLCLNNKVVFSNIKRVSEMLIEISKCKKSSMSMIADFPAFSGMFPAGVVVPNTNVLINGVRNEVEVLNSLQRPKRICFVGEDGRMYYWLCKNQDDLRKDSRFMDLNNIINNMAKKKEGEMYIRTYAVIPFNHESGIIEWIEGLSSLKAICEEYYTREGVSISEVARRFAKSKRVGQKDWMETVMRFPPRFHMWFYDNFSNPFNWLLARNNFTRTYAMMNIVGWFMGLGDRHAENILFDSKTGDTIHVDLNCIFGKGNEISVPERVPYRLTQNIVDAFGVMGLEGLYSDALCGTLELFLRNKNVLVSNLLSFVYDPLFEWRRKSVEMPKKIIAELSIRLEDLDASSKCETLNEEAMSDENLCMMYIGWLPFI
ncbi:kinase domain-containing protein [Ordospora pajunii]|uniref:kinase domain-containing protein n=1 Tax=Ordospora pajunii TaxID=3039483 RepID=UPI0029527D21|nr:kinase domain-containing protein [Ordospora pajunii]KAH9411956.1 kinase domain-containing protein [Ordospora pajunii]